MRYVSEYLDNLRFGMETSCFVCRNEYTVASL